MSLSCQSCGVPLINEHKSTATDNYCVNCVDGEGKLLSREIIQQGIAGWLEGFARETEGVNFMKRAEYYLKSMPAWADQ